MFLLPNLWFIEIFKVKFHEWYFSLIFFDFIIDNAIIKIFSVFTYNLRIIEPTFKINVIHFYFHNLFRLFSFGYFHLINEQVGNTDIVLIFLSFFKSGNYKHNILILLRIQLNLHLNQIFSLIVLNFEFLFTLDCFSIVL